MFLTNVLRSGKDATTLEISGAHRCTGQSQKKVKVGEVDPSIKVANNWHPRLSFPDRPDPRNQLSIIS